MPRTGMLTGVQPLKHLRGANVSISENTMYAYVCIITFQVGMVASERGKKVQKTANAFSLCQSHCHAFVVRLCETKVY